jgi:hypothetical protein
MSLNLVELENRLSDSYLDMAMQAEKEDDRIWFQELGTRMARIAREREQREALDWWNAEVNPKDWN